MTVSKPEVLIVDDSATVRAAITKLLGENYVTHTATDGEQGWHMLNQNPAICLVFADMHMPVLNGMLLLQRIRQSDDERIANLPVIMITGVEKPRAARRACHTVGATDFISKPFDTNDIMCRARHYTRLSQRIAEFNQDSRSSVLTGLNSNRALIDFGTRAMQFSLEHKLHISVLYTEIANNEILARTYGSHTSEQIAQTVEDRLREDLRKDEFLSRIDEGKFVVVLPMTQAFKAHIIASRLKKSISKIEFDIDGNKERVSLAAGLACISGTADEQQYGFKDICLQAAMALHASRQTEGHPVVRYDARHNKLAEGSPGKLNINMPEQELVHDAIALEEFGDFFTGILLGDYSGIPQDYIPSLIAPLENFLEYAYRLRQQETQQRAG